MCYLIKNQLPGQVGTGGGVTASALLYGNKSNGQSINSKSSGSFSWRGGFGGSSHRGEESVTFEPSEASRQQGSGSNTDEAVLSSAMVQLRNPGVLIVAHGSRGKPKTVRLQLTETSITWRTETRKKNLSGQHTSEIKLGKLHSVSLANIMYVDVGKQTTALRRVENASVPESLCFSLLTKEGSLDLEANSPRERDALISCFSLVLDEVHAQNWRDIYRGSNGIPSSFDEYDEEMAGNM